VFVPVADQVRALEFYIGKLGCEKRADFPTGRSLDRGGPSGSAIAIALVPPSDGRSAGSDEAHCALATEDIEADHATLRARGVEVDHGGLAGATGWCFAGSPGSARRRELAARYPESREAQTCGTCC
jgi:catechol 2,3-dioxygenase-like lactoylglutathione lyase family enzyme